MKKPEQISSELKNNEWPEFSKHPFIDEVLFKTVFSQIKNDEEVVSQLWGVRLNEQGELTSQYELLTLTNNHFISVYSDLNNENDKVHVYSQSLKKVDRFSIKPSKIHPGYVAINIVLNGVNWSLESNDLQTSDHFNKKVDELLVKAREQKQEDVTASLMDEDLSNPSLKTVHSDFLTKAKKRSKERNKKNLEFMRKYAKNNVIWYSIIIIASFFGVTISATYIGIINAGAPNDPTVIFNYFLIYQRHKTSLVVAGSFALVFALLNTVCYIMLTMKVWDKEHFSRNLYRVIFQLLLSIILIIFSILMIVKMNGTAYTVALYMLPISFYLMADAGYLLTKTYVDLKQVKSLK